MYRAGFNPLETDLPQNGSAEKLIHGSCIDFAAQMYPRAGLSGSVGSITALHLARRSRLQAARAATCVARK
jgi:hypothetical protein